MPENDLVTQPDFQSASGNSVRRLSVGPVKPEAFTIVATDFGADCDDQKAISQAIAALGPREEIAFVVGGPHPPRAAEAIAQSYHEKAGKYPIVALATQFEQNKVPEDKIFSLKNGEAMLGQEVNGFKPVGLEEFHKNIDYRIKNGNVKSLRQCVFCPLHKHDEYYNPASRLESDPALKSAWEKLPKTAVVQFLRTASDDGKTFKYRGNNFQKSGDGVSQEFTEMLAAQGYKTTYFDGSVSKDAEFSLSVRPGKLPGVEKAAASYTEGLQVPWANMPGKSGTTPAISQMHVGMFTKKAEVPFGAHVTGGTDAGFGVERLAKEVCGISTEDERYAGFTDNIGRELDRFDRQVLSELHERMPERKNLDLASMRALMHADMAATLRDFADEKGLAGKPIANFKQLATTAKDNGVELNAYGYMPDFKKRLFEKSPLVEEITSIAEREANRRGPDGKTHLDRMTGILQGYDVRAVVYDAVALAASNVLERNPDLAAYFKEADGACNVTSAKVGSLRNSTSKPDRALFQKFVGGIRDEMTRDGGAMANDWSMDSPTASIAAVEQAAPQAAEQSGRKRGIDNVADGSIADRVKTRRREGLGL